MSFYFGFDAYFISTKPDHKILIATAICSLSTYYLHGFLNNFLDTDKAAVIFWTLTAMIVFFNIETKKSTK